ncbi:7-carboxy-7-deazaguanine synthase QueE [Patescibacteria group bacterium]|uniref:Putative iron-sulfur binding domain containing protein n=1 Tax=viral metagenome TaxID=1070528 RepID=A0A6M3M441_9ZZZZ|nr:7-carboxy-7-deazaguanine synthase QueE [Patescibacteria group bacterium]MBU0847520.1 7-carboxy-7-deazaguanine synthase QueE [Patescibacteria group bacterium]
MKIYSIFESINGEITRSHQGSICTFIRLAGCNLKCSFCDSEYAQGKNTGKEMSITKIINDVVFYGNKNVTITGGEPLRKAIELKELVVRLSELNHQVSIETNGSYKIPSDWPVYCWVADWKGPSSGMRDKMRINNFSALDHTDFIKFVIKNYADFNDAMATVMHLTDAKNFTPRFAFSPMFGEGPQGELTKWMLKEPILKERGAIFNLQIHKIIDVQ